MAPRLQRGEAVRGVGASRQTLHGGSGGHAGQAGGDGTPTQQLQRQQHSSFATRAEGMCLDARAQAHRFWGRACRHYIPNVVVTKRRDGTCRDTNTVRNQQRGDHAFDNCCWTAGNVPTRSRSQQPIYSNACRGFASTGRLLGPFICVSDPREQLHCACLLTFFFLMFSLSVRPYSYLYEECCPQRHPRFTV